MNLGFHAPKTKACAVCQKPFTPARPMQRVCGFICSKKVPALERKAERARVKERKRALETIPELIKVAQREFNKWVRTRDQLQPCISCGKQPGGSGFHEGRDAGHYRSVGSASHLRFHEDNCNAQCVHCNQFKAGKAVEYRIGLIGRIGVERVEALESSNEPHKWTKEELRQIAATYRAKLKQLKEQNE
jgi:hypothetical protein